MIALRTVWLVVNQRSGRVSADAGAALTRQCRDHGLQPLGLTALHESEAIDVQLLRSVRPDAIVVLAGDGSLRTVLDQLDAADDPPVIPLSGGTMNILPRKVLGDGAWPDQLDAVLAAPRLSVLPAGEVDGKRFFVAAVLGMPALWQIPREAIRARRLGLAWRGARAAWGRAFGGPVHLTLDAAPAQPTEAVVVVPEAEGLEIAALATGNLWEALGLAMRHLADDWRHHPSVTTHTALQVRIGRRRRKTPALLDGEFFLLPSEAPVRHVAGGARFLAQTDAAPAPV